MAVIDEFALIIKVQWGGISDEDEREERDVRGRLVGAESMGVSDLHDGGGAAVVVADADHQRRSSLHV